MVNAAEKSKSEDVEQRENISARNTLSTFAFNVNQTCGDVRIGGKMTPEDRKSVEDKATEVMAWIKENDDAKKAECDDKYNELEQLAASIMKNL